MRPDESEYLPVLTRQPARGWDDIGWVTVPQSSMSLFAFKLALHALYCRTGSVHIAAFPMEIHKTLCLVVDRSLLSVRSPLGSALRRFSCTVARSWEQFACIYLSLFGLTRRLAKFAVEFGVREVCHLIRTTKRFLQPRISLPRKSVLNLLHSDSNIRDASWTADGQ